MEFLKHLRILDDGLKIAEQSLLDGDLKDYQQVLEQVTQGPFAKEAQERLERVRQLLDEYRQLYSSSSRRHYQQNYHSEISDGYAPPKEGREYWPKSADSVPKIMAYVQRDVGRDLVRHLWYWEMTQTIDFVDKYVEKYGNMMFAHKRMVTTYKGNVAKVPVEEMVPPSSFLDEFYDLSAFRELSNDLWKRIVNNSIRRRVKTPLEQVARFLQLKLPWVHWIARMDKPKDDEITRDLVYICKNPDFTSELLVDVPITEDGQVIYLVVCPSCGRNNKQGILSCFYCGSKI